MSRREIVVLVCGLAIATALTIYGTILAVEWFVPSDRYGRSHDGMGVVPKTK
jgi:hypothetical protein